MKSVLKLQSASSRLRPPSRPSAIIKTECHRAELNEDRVRTERGWERRKNSHLGGKIRSRRHENLSLFSTKTHVLTV